MGVLWTVWSLDEEIKPWLDKQGIAYPRVASRFPTGSEVKKVIAALADFDVNISDNGVGAHWQASIVSTAGGDTGPWTLLNISKYAGDDEQQKIWFEKGWESLITEVVRELSRSSGPLVLMPDTGDAPTVISAQTYTNS